MRRHVSPLRTAVLGAALAILATGCATDGSSSSDAAPAERAEAVTGTRIPNRKASPPPSTDSEQREKSVERKEPQKAS